MIDFNKDKIFTWLTHPNTLTAMRVALVPFFVVLMLFENRYAMFMATLVFCIAGITDYFDGFYARKRGQESDVGKMMDPLADKLLVGAAFIMLVEHGWVPGWMVCIIIGREMAVTGLRNVLVAKGEDVAASKLAKYKTASQMAALIPLLLHYPYFGIDLHAVGTVVLWVALVLTLWSGADYFIRFRKVFA